MKLNNIIQTDDKIELMAKKTSIDGKKKERKGVVWRLEC